MKSNIEGIIPLKGLFSKLEEISSRAVSISFHHDLHLHTSSILLLAFADQMQR